MEFGWLLGGTGRHCFPGKEFSKYIVMNFQHFVEQVNEGMPAPQFGTVRACPQGLVMPSPAAAFLAGVFD